MSVGKVLLRVTCSVAFQHLEGQNYMLCFFEIECQSVGRSPDLRLSKQAVLTTVPGPPVVVDDSMVDSDLECKHTLL